MPIRLTRHAREQAAERGAEVGEIEAAIRSEHWTEADFGRLECSRDFAFEREWKGTTYPVKRVRPIFVEEESEVVVVTVYTYYF
jgi:hypothetical protein